MSGDGKKFDFVGAPVEIGSKVFTELCMPVVQEATNKLNPTKQQLGQLYAGFLGAAVGSMVAEFGKAQAIAWAQQTLDMVEASDFEELTPRRH
jgi:hypothetical protein